MAHCPVGNKKAAEAAYKSMLLLLLFQLNQMHVANDSGQRITSVGDVSSNRYLPAQIQFLDTLAVWHLKLVFLVLI